MDKLVLMVGLGAASLLLVWGGAGVALADNIVGNTNSITMSAGTTNSELRIKDVATSASDPGGDPVDGCNIGVKNDGILATVTLSITPDNGGLTATPNPVVFDECGQKAAQTITLAATIGGTYQITASAVDNDPRDGVFHYPIGTITVTVIDNVPPETTITLGPNDPTANQTATFTFSSDEAGSTFECKIDSDAFSACTSPAEYTGLAVGDHTFQVTATDPSGNTDATPASFAWTIKAVTVGISVSPASAFWGENLSASGVADLVDKTTLTLVIDWGDGSTADATILNGAWGPVSHSYADPGDYQVTAILMDGLTPYLSSEPASVAINKRPTKLSLAIPDAVTGDTGLNARGFLTEDLPGDSQIPDGVITFDGSGSNPSFTPVTTEGVTVTGGIEFVSCTVGTCSEETIGIFPIDNNNIVLRVSPGTEIKIPLNTPQAAVIIQGTTPFKWTIYGNPDVPLPCPNGGGFECAETPGGAVMIGGPSNLGVSKIVITEIDGSPTDGFVDISAILTSNFNGKPLEQREINFENEVPGPVGSPVTFDAGSYSSLGIVQEDAEQGLELQAHFAGNSHFEGSDSNIGVFKVDFQSTPSNSGVGGESEVGNGVAASRDLCVVDSDKDGICSTPNWEDGTVERSAGGVYTLFEAPAGDNTPDLFYEADCMNGFCPPASDFTAVAKRFDLKGIKLHIQYDGNLASPVKTDVFPANNPFHVWTDGDATAKNSFVEVKNSLYGTSAERGGVTLEQGNNKLKAKLQVVRYLVVVNNINSGTNTACGTSGTAEYRGNDAVVAVNACGFGTNPREEMQGTVMHEFGHNVGLKHGGGDDDNCKPNQIGVMSYKGQVPTSVLGKPSAAQLGDGDATVETVNQVPWILDYNREVFPTLVESDIDDGFVLNITPSKWIASDGKDQIGSFKIVYGTPQLATKVQTGYTGAAGINWDKDANTELNQKMDVNYMAVTIGAKVITSCQPANSYYSSYPVDKAESHVSYDEWQIVKNNLDDFASYGTFDGVHTDPDFWAEPGEFIEALDLAGLKFSGVDPPVNNVDLGSTDITKIKQGNTIPVKFDLFDSHGNEITGDNALSVYNITKIIIRVAVVTGGNPPADSDYSPPLSSTQPGNPEVFTWDGNKWQFSLGTKNLQVNKTYAARVDLVFATNEQVTVEAGTDGITFLFNSVKNI